MTSKLYAAALALLGFSTSMFIGLWVDNPFVTVVMRSLAVLVLFFILGLILSGVGQKVIEENFNDETETLQATGLDGMDLNESELEIPTEQENLEESPLPAAHG